MTEEVSQYSTGSTPRIGIPRYTKASKMDIAIGIKQGRPYLHPYSLITLYTNKPFFQLIIDTSEITLSNAFTITLQWKRHQLSFPFKYESCERFHSRAHGTSCDKQSA